MREILFRGKRADNGEWVEGFYIESKYHNDRNLYRIVEKDNWCDEYEGYYYNEYDVIPETVGQFTGLTDRNGNKIFEGDIVAVEGENIQAVVKYRDDKAAFFVENDDEEEYFGEAETDVIVIGNIYDFCTEYHLLLSGDSNAD